MLSEEGKREIELMNQLLKAKSIKEVLDISNRLDWDVSEEEAREFLGLLTSDEIKKDKNSGDPHLKIVGIIPATDEERLELMQKLLNFSVEEAKELLAKMNERRKEQHPTWEEFFDATKREEKEAILQKMYGGTLTPEEIEAFFPKDDDRTGGVDNGRN